MLCVVEVEELGLLDLMVEMVEDYKLLVKMVKEGLLALEVKHIRKVHYLHRA